MNSTLRKPREILAIIPARSGSKGIPDKNIRVIGRKPLLAHSIDHAKMSSLITRTIVSTDSENYADIARHYGAEVPFLRPSCISQDLSTDLEVFQHALEWLAQNEQYHPDLCVHLRPTYPLRNAHDIDAMIQVVMNNEDLDSVRSIAPAPATPFKMWFRNEAGLLSPVVEGPLPDSYNLPRQLLPAVYLQNAAIDVVRTRVIREQHSMTGRKIFGYIMDHDLDIDYEQQLKVAAQYLGESV